MTTKTLGRGLGTALSIVAVVGISSLPAYADSGTCYVGCSPPTTITTGGGGGGTGSGGGGGGTGSGGSGGTRPPVTKSAGGSSGSGSGSSGSGGSGGKATLSSAGSGGSLPFTGADIEEMTIGGAGALLVGGLLVRRSRSRRRVEA